MIPRCLLLFLWLFLIMQCTAVDCTEMSLSAARQFNYESSDIVCLGILKNIENGIGEFITVESYKGIISKKIYIKNIHYQENDVFSLWIIYAYNEKQDTFYLSNCQLSRSLSNPISIYHNPPPPQIATKNANHITNVDIIKNKVFENQWRNEFYDEIEILRALEAYHNIESKETQNNYSEINIWNIAYIGFLFIILSILIYLCHTIRKTMIISKRHGH